jgi:hypothetical protein
MTLAQVYALTQYKVFQPAVQMAVHWDVMMVK